VTEETDFIERALHQLAKAPYCKVGRASSNARIINCSSYIQYGLLYYFFPLQMPYLVGKFNEQANACNVPANIFVLNKPRRFLLLTHEVQRDGPRTVLHIDMGKVQCAGFSFRNLSRKPLQMKTSGR
jgi:hypothetical protein